MVARAMCTSTCGMQILSALFLLLAATPVALSRNNTHMNNEEQWSSLNVALVQYPLVGYLTTEQLYSKVKNYAEKSSHQGANLVLIPELFSLDLLDFTKSEMEQFDQIIDELYPSFNIEMQKFADELNIYILAGSVPIKVQGKIRNRSYLFGPHSNTVFQDKIFLTPDEVEWGWEGGNKLTVIQAPWGNTAIVICYDSEIPLISHTLTKYQLDLILVPSMTGNPGFTRVRWATQARAVEHMSYVLVSGTTGAPAEGWEMTAQAAVLGPSLSGFTPLIAEGNLNEDNQIVFATLDMQQLLEAKARGSYYPAKDQQSYNDNGLDVEMVSL
jgi:predicted amidohydrolase